MQKLLPAFFIALSCALFFPAHLPFLKLIFFAPYLVIVFYRCTFYKALWQSVMAGLTIDLLSSQAFFGLHMLCHLSTTFILYGQKRTFFAERQATLWMMTFFFSVIYSLFQALFSYFFAQPLHLSFQWVLSDLCLFPFIDGVYAIVCFSFPYFMIKKFKHIKKTST